MQYESSISQFHQLLIAIISVGVVDYVLTEDVLLLDTYSFQNDLRWQSAYYDQLRNETYVELKKHDVEKRCERKLGWRELSVENEATDGLGDYANNRMIEVLEEEGDEFSKLFSANNDDFILNDQLTNYYDEQSNILTKEDIKLDKLNSEEEEEKEILRRGYLICDFNCSINNWLYLPLIRIDMESDVKDLYLNLTLFSRQCTEMNYDESSSYANSSPQTSSEKKGTIPCKEFIKLFLFETHTDELNFIRGLQPLNEHNTHQEDDEIFVNPNIYKKLENVHLFDKHGTRMIRIPLRKIDRNDSFVEKDWQMNNQIFRQTNTNSTRPNKRYRYIKIGIEDRGACITLTRIVFFYRRCREMVKNLIRFNSIASGIESSVHHGVCVENSKLKSTLSFDHHSTLMMATRSNYALCNPKGKWQLLDELIGCYCKSGYELSGSNENSCKVCPKNFIKPNDGNHRCEKCPVNSIKTRELILKESKEEFCECLPSYLVNRFTNDTKSLGKTVRDNCHPIPGIIDEIEILRRNRFQINLKLKLLKNMITPTLLERINKFNYRHYNQQQRRRHDANIILYVIRCTSCQLDEYGNYINNFNISFSYRLRTAGNSTDYFTEQFSDHLMTTIRFNYLLPETIYSFDIFVYSSDLHHLYHPPLMNLLSSKHIEIETTHSSGNWETSRDLLNLTNFNLKCIQSKYSIEKETFTIVVNWESQLNVLYRTGFIVNQCEIRIYEIPKLLDEKDSVPINYNFSRNDFNLKLRSFKLIEMKTNENDSHSNSFMADGLKKNDCYLILMRSELENIHQIYWTSFLPHMNNGTTMGLRFCLNDKFLKSVAITQEKKEGSDGRIRNQNFYKSSNDQIGKKQSTSSIIFKMILIGFITCLLSFMFILIFIFRRQLWKKRLVNRQLLYKNLHTIHSRLFQSKLSNENMKRKNFNDSDSIYNYSTTTKTCDILDAHQQQIHQEKIDGNEKNRIMNYKQHNNVNESLTSKFSSTTTSSGSESGKGKKHSYSVDQEQKFSITLSSSSANYSPNSQLNPFQKLKNRLADYYQQDKKSTNGDYAIQQIDKNTTTTTSADSVQNSSKNEFHSNDEQMECNENDRCSESNKNFISQNFSKLIPYSDQSIQKIPHNDYELKKFSIISKTEPQSTIIEQSSLEQHNYQTDQNMNQNFLPHFNRYKQQQNKINSSTKLIRFQPVTISNNGLKSPTIYSFTGNNLKLGDNNCNNNNNNNNNNNKKNNHLLNNGDVRTIFDEDDLSYDHSTYRSSTRYHHSSMDRKSNRRSKRKKRSRNSNDSHQRSMVLYKDPFAYEDITKAVEEFTNELNPIHVRIDSIIGGGEFGDVCLGQLNKLSSTSSSSTILHPKTTTTNCSSGGTLIEETSSTVNMTKNRMMKVAIKTLKTDCGDKARNDFLTEASIMGQFKHPRIIQLLGVVTRTEPHMIVTEYMELGSLDSWLQKQSSTQVDLLVLLGILKDVAEGMEYLSSKQFVHRDLAARNILLCNTCRAKVADFGLSRHLIDINDEDEIAYTTKGGKIPVRWTAPEAIAFRRFDTWSDVWSYGILIWEVMTLGERPYWNWSNQDVIRAVDANFRLPPPTISPLFLYELMLKCWQEERIRRPLFHQIHSILHRVLHHQHFRQQQHHTINDLPLASERYHSMLIDTEKPDYTQTTTIDEWLQSLQLNDLVTLFHIKGFHNLAFLIHTPLTPNALCRLCGITSIKRIECISRSLQQIRSHIFAYYDNLQQQTSSSTEDDEDDDDGEDHVREERKQKSCPYSTNNDMKLNKNFIETTSSSQTEYDCSSDVHLSEVHHPQHNYLLHEQQDSQRISFPYFTTSTGNFV